LKIVAKIFASLFGIGYFPIAPGTLASFVILLLYKYYLHKWDWPLYLGILAACFLLGVLASSSYSTSLNKKDPGCIVIDEAAGQLLVFFQLAPSWTLLLIGFFMFRIFDIIKPFPIRKAEAFPKGWGIMLDDVIAAAYAGILIHIYLLLR
jgi:phosphatidylglycerophosphatase A